MAGIRGLEKSEGAMLERLPEWQLGWLAGMLDGEGCISIHKKGGPSVAIASTTPIGEVLQWMTGMGSVTTTFPQDRKTVYQWTVSSVVTVHKLLCTLSPHLLIKKKQCELMLKYCEERIAEQLYHNPVDRKPYIEEMRELNKGIIE